MTGAHIATLQLAWPVDLFMWEAARVRTLPDNIVVEGIEHLLGEAFHDATVLAEWREVNPLDPMAWNSGPAVSPDDARAWLADLISHRERMHTYRPIPYFAERSGAAAHGSVEGDLCVSFAGFVGEMQDRGYFPKVLPRECLDDPVDYASVCVRIRGAIKLPFEWNGTQAEARDWDEATLYSLIEYFHDGAQRPRSRGREHAFADCGFHYAEHNADAGQLVYRWRVNELLSRFSAPVKLGKSGLERGRLVKRFDSDLDTQADLRATIGAEDRADIVAAAIRSFRRRDATAPDRRAALGMLAGVLENRRKEVKRVLGADETALFNIANNFGLRHNNERQQVDYGDDFLDYLFAILLAAVLLMERMSPPQSGQ